MRVYLPATTTTLRELLDAGAVGPAAADGLRGDAGPAGVVRRRGRRGAGVRGDVRGGAGSLRLLDADPHAARRRVVIAADVPDDAVTCATTSISASSESLRRLRWPRWRRCTSTTPTPRRPWPRRPRRSSPPISATRGSQDAVDDAEGYELSWYATQEIGPLLELL